VAKGKNQWVTPRSDGKWQHKGEGNKKATKVTDTQEEARQSAEDVARNKGGEVIVQGEDHKIVSKDSYGKDPNPPKDKEH
jgi:hypothetical protein